MLMIDQWVGRDLVSISDLKKDEIECVLDTALRLRKETPSDLCKGSILASCFYEPSTRTRLSFEAAMHRLGGSVIGFSESSNTSAKKGETLSDSIRVISAYADILAIRHPLEGSAKLAAEVSDKPIINAGDGANQHPTQTLLDLFSIRECQNTIDDLSIAIVGDLKFGRTVHSLCLALLHYRVRLYFVSPEPLSLPNAIIQELRHRGMKFSFHATLSDIITKVDILYMTRIQKERMEEIEIENTCRLHASSLKLVKANLKIFHPLPRVDEIDPTIDRTPYAYYFQQAENGLYVRMALLALLLGKL
jgi:aspartate carbamoyltransferase catalytic subunit